MEHHWRNGWPWRWGHVFGRRHAKTRQELVRAEFGETFDLLKQAASHAAGGVGATVGPRYGAAKNRMGNARGQLGPGASKVSSAASHGWESTIAALAPLAEAARQGSVKASKLPHSKEVRIRSLHIKESGGKGKRKAVSDNDSGHHMPTGLIMLLAAGAAIGATGALVARRRNRTKWAEYDPASVRSDAASTRPPMDATHDDEMPSTAAKLAAWAKDHTKSAADTVRSKLHDVTADTSDRLGDRPDRASNAKDRIGDGASHLADKTEARMNDASGRRTGMSGDNAADRATDEVDDLLRSTKNGRM